MTKIFRVLLAAVTLLATTIGLGAPAFAGKQDFVLINRTGYTISRVYVSASSTNDWEEDVLGSDVLNAGGRVTIRFSSSANACLHDLKVVYSDGDEATWSGFNLCEVSVIAITYDSRTGKTSATTE